METNKQTNVGRSKWQFWSLQFHIFKHRCRPDSPPSSSPPPFKQTNVKRSLNLKILVILTFNQKRPSLLTEENEHHNWYTFTHTDTHIQTHTHIYTQARICLLLTCRQHFTYGEVCWPLTFDIHYVDPLPPLYLSHVPLPPSLPVIE